MMLKKIFTKKEKTGLKPMGVITTIERPKQDVNRLTDEERQKMNDEFFKRKQQSERVNPYFIQEISDRLYGPDADDYIKALVELNSKFRPRIGRTGPQIYRDEI